MFKTCVDILLHATACFGVIARFRNYFSFLLFCEVLCNYVFVSLFVFLILRLSAILNAKFCFVPRNNYATGTTRTQTWLRSMYFVQMFSHSQVHLSCIFLSFFFFWSLIFFDVYCAFFCKTLFNLWLCPCKRSSW